MHGAVRIALAVAAAAALLGGLVLIGGGDPGMAVVGTQLVVAAIVLTLALAFERSRYRSAATERRVEPAGPGGGEPLGASNVVEPRFRATDEVFIDPTSGRTMRVYADPRTGERRYLAEA